MKSFIIFSVTFALSLFSTGALAFAGYDYDRSLSNYVPLHLEEEYECWRKSWAFNAFEQDYLKDRTILKVAPIYLLQANGNIPLRSVCFSDNMAHEQMSIALLCAGLVGFPFVRRLKKYMISETREL